MSASAGRLWKRAIIHVDMDAFYASVELKDRPEFTGRPVVVGGRPEERGVVAAASYEARGFGIHSAMPMARAVRLCPDLIIMSPRFDRYREESQAVREVLERYSPLIEPLSLDEAFLEVTGSQRLHGPAPTMARHIREAVRRERELSASVGVASSKFVAKVASDLKKPGGLVVVEPGSEEEFLRPLPVSRMWGVGPVTERALGRLGVRTIGDLQRVSASALRPEVGGSAQRLIQLAHGRDDTPVTPPGRPKSLSAETTFTRDLTDPAEMERVLLGLAEGVAARLRTAGLTARRLTLKVRLADFHTLTRSTTLKEPTHSTEVIYQATSALLRLRADLEGRAVRLLGIAAGHLSPEHPQQLELFARREPSRAERLDRVADEVRRRLGPEALRRGRLLQGRLPTSERPARRRRRATPSSPRDKSKAT